MKEKLKKPLPLIGSAGATIANHKLYQASYRFARKYLLTVKRLLRPAWRRAKPILSPLALPVLAGFVGLFGAFTIIHFTPLHYKTDPLAKIVEFTRVTFANNDVEKANAHLAIAEAKLRDFIRLREKSPDNISTLGMVAGEMVQHDKKAMTYMDRAKQGGQDIKKLNLVKRLCDSLGMQSKELSATNPELNNLHSFAAQLEDKVSAGQDIASAMEEVEKSLGAAMQW